MTAAFPPGTGGVGEGQGLVRPGVIHGTLQAGPQTTWVVSKRKGSGIFPTQRHDEFEFLLDGAELRLIPCFKP